MAACVEVASGVCVSVVNTVDVGFGVSVSGSVVFLTAVGGVVSTDVAGDRSVWDGCPDSPGPTTTSGVFSELDESNIPAP